MKHGQSVDWLAKLEVLVKDEEQLGAKSPYASKGCIATALEGFFPKMDVVRVFVFNTIPSYTEVLGVFRGSSIQTKGKATTKI